MAEVSEYGIVGVNDRVLNDVEIPLKNLEYTIDQYLMANGTRLDAQTRQLLAGVRDCVGRVAVTTRFCSAR